MGLLAARTKHPPTNERKKSNSTAISRLVSKARFAWMLFSLLHPLPNKIRNQLSTAINSECKKSSQLNSINFVILKHLYRAHESIEAIKIVNWEQTVIFPTVTEFMTDAAMEQCIPYVSLLFFLNFHYTSTGWHTCGCTHNWITHMENDSKLFCNAFSVAIVLFHMRHVKCVAVF